MKLIYTTSNKYPSHKFANTAQVLAMAREFRKKLDKDFYLGGKNFILDKEKWQVINGQTPKSYILSYKFLRFIKKNQINYVYCREARLLFFIILYNKIFFHLKLKYIYELHAMVERNLVDKIVEKTLSGWVNKFIFLTNELCNIYVKKYKVSKNKIMIASDAVDLSIFDIDISKEQAREKLFQNIPSLAKGGVGGVVILGYTGKFKTMGMDKGISDILKALTKLKDDIIFIAIGGNKDDIDYYQKQAKELKIENKAIFKEHVSQAELAIFQKACDLLLMPFPSKEHYLKYMSPLKMFEYMAAKRPIIATNLPTTKEVLKNNHNAILVKPDNPEELAQEIERVLADQNLSNKISEQAYKDVRNYTWERRVEKILKLIK